MASPTDVGLKCVDTEKDEKDVDMYDLLDLTKNDHEELDYNEEIVVEKKEVTENEKHEISNTTEFGTPDFKTAFKNTPPSWSYSNLLNDWHRGGVNDRRRRFRGNKQRHQVGRWYPVHSRVRTTVSRRLYLDAKDHTRNCSEEIGYHWLFAPNRKITHFRSNKLVKFEDLTEIFCQYYPDADLGEVSKCALPIMMAFSHLWHPKQPCLGQQIAEFFLQYFA